MSGHRLAIALLVLLGGLVQGPGIDRCFGPQEQNAGCYFGVFARNFEHLGFGPTRGVPLGLTLLEDVSQGSPYLNHPPGHFWLNTIVGTEEWQLRIVTVLAAMLAAIFMFLLLVDLTGVLPAFAAGAIVELAPVTALFSQES